MTPDLPTFAIGIVFGLMLGRPDLVLKLRDGIRKQKESLSKLSASSVPREPSPPRQ